jgi:PAS domain S-box-containing protein
MNNFEDDLADTPARTRSERQINNIRKQGGFFVEAVRLTRMPMIVTDATLPGNPTIFANQAFLELSGYELDEVTGQEPHFMNGPETDAVTICRYQAAMEEGQDENVEILQSRKDRQPFLAMLFASPLDDGQGTVLHHFLSYLDITRRHEAEQGLRHLTEQLEARVAARTTELQVANEDLSRLVQEKQMLLAEVNHRAKNSLSIASALLGLQGRRQRDPQVKALFAETQDRLLAMSRVHDLLSKSQTIQQVSLCTYLHDLCEALRPIAERDDCIRLAVECEETIFVHAEDAIPLGIIATELITNAVKHAFPPPACGTIAVRARKLADSQIAFSVQDDGAGMAAARDGSLGYSLVETLTKKLRGVLDVEESPGVTATITFRTFKE